MFVRILTANKFPEECPKIKYSDADHSPTTWQSVSQPIFITGQTGNPCSQPPARLLSRPAVTFGLSVGRIVVIIDMVPFKKMTIETRLETRCHHVVDMLVTDWPNVPDR